MFNFLFEGKLGEMLAPVMPMNQLYLSIQNHRNNEVQSLIMSKQFDLRKASEAGYMAIHVACRYNNVGAIDLIVQQGIPIDMPDNNGNTTLHYAAKAGHLDLCKLLIDRGCSPARRNSSNQTPYDYTDNHLVRQYLLPLIFKYENGQIPNQQQESNYDNSYQAQNQMEYSASTQQSYYPPPEPSYNPPVNGYSPSQSFGQQYSPQNLSEVPLTSEPTASNSYSIQPPSYPSSVPDPPSYSQPPSYPPSGQQVPVYSQLAPPPPQASPSYQSSTSDNFVRKIKADGFHSSASDPQLQAKYGHIKPAINIAPPPTAPLGQGTVNQYSAYSATGNPSLVYNRYPVYDPLAAPSPKNQTGPSTSYQAPLPTYQPPPATSSMFPPPPAPQYNAAYNHTSSPYKTPYAKQDEEIVSADATSSSVL